MSLLMDALKKAEQAKRQDQDDRAPEASSPSLNLELEPIPQGSVAPAPAPESPPPPSPVPQGGTTLPELPKHLEALDDEFLAHHASSPPKPKSAANPLSEPRSLQASPAEAASKRAAPGQAGSVSDKAAAQNAFAAKRAPKSGNAAFGIAVGAVTLVAVAGIGVYFWLQLQPKSATSGGGLLALFKPAAPPAPVRAANPTQPVSPAALPPPATPVAAVPPPPAATAVPPAPTSSRPGKAASQPAEDEDDGDRPVPPRARSKVPVAEAGSQPVRVTKSAPVVSPVLSGAFEALGKGDLATAQASYDSVIKAEPRNADALHGLAAVALRQKRFADAEQYFRRLLDIDPKDPVAAAELINLRGMSDPLAAESRLKALIASQPDLSQPHFALGNLYAAQGRWNEAQNAYFKAYTAEADNPDVLFNLAVSLEHLRQNRLALQYYQQALALAQSRPAGFDKAQAGARIKALQP